MSFQRLLLLLLFTLQCSISQSADLSSRLRSYETLHHSDLIGSSSSSRQKRATHVEQLTSWHNHGKPEAIEKITLTTLNRTFTLLLTENRNLLSPHFKVTVVKDDGVEEDTDIRPHTFYKGIVEGESGSEVLLHWETDRAVSAKIVTSTDIYYIEPSDGHLPPSSNYTMLSYKASDLVRQGECGGARHVPNITYAEEDDSDSSVMDDTSEEVKDRKRRETTGVKNTCGLLLVVDNRFLTQIMNGVVGRATNYVVDLVSKVNAIYRKTEFGRHRGLGFQIDRIKIHTDSSNDPDHYNYGNRNIDIVDDSTVPNPVNVLLDAFGRVDKSGGVNYRKFCLAHLFTAYAFGNGVLGLAYIASPNKKSLGGICSPSYYDSRLSANVYLNTGWSSAYNREGKKILTQEAEIVLAHELGHNWGSEHDPDSCSPSDAEGGKYIMYTYSVNGFKPNNKRFSSCSTNSVGRVLDTKKGDCFTEMTSLTKGNFVRDDGEDCDAGTSGNECCTNDQKYTPGSDCSDSNDKCCTNCNIRDARGKLCATRSDLTCDDNSYCNGTSRECEPRYKSVGETCQSEFGRCWRDNESTDKNATKCIGLAEVLGITQCTCENTDEDQIAECKLCYKKSPTEKCVAFKTSDLSKYISPCADDPSKTCATHADGGKTVIQPYDLNALSGGKDYILLVNSTCRGGYCSANGTCTRQSTDLVARFWDFLTHLGPGAVVEFMRANIVGCVAVFSLILWMPCVIAVYCYDRKQAKKAKLEDQAYRSMSIKAKRQKKW